VTSVPSNEGGDNLGLSEASADSVWAAFQAAAPGHAAPRGTERAFGRRLLALWEAARLQRPGVSLPLGTFLRAVAASVDPEALDGSLDRLAAGDLLLACAGSRGDAAAIGVIQRELFPTVGGGLRRAGYSEAEAEEVLAALLGDLVVADGRAPLLRQYRGRGHLIGWLRVSALRLAGRIFGRRREIPVSEAGLALLCPVGANPELDYLKRHYVREFSDAFSEVVAAMPPGERTLLRLHLVERLSIDQLGAIYHLHRATIARRISRAQSELLDGVRARLLARLRVTAPELDSILRLIESRIEVVFPRLADPGR
jgi:RNA polymerase sigma-70 factor (ECF subfamily)